MSQRIDLHVHTKFSEWKHLRAIKPRDSYNDPFEVWKTSKARGMTFVTITDHDTIEGALDLLSRHPELEPEIIIGEEVEAHFPDTKQWVHVNVFGLDERVHDDITRLKPNVHELVAYLRANGLFHVLNHPFQSYSLQKPPAAYLSDILELFEFFEVGNGTLPRNHDAAVQELLDCAATFHLTRHGVGGSDAHDPRDIAIHWTEVDIAAGSVTKEGMLAALKRGEGRAAGQRIGAASLTANVYRIIGRYYMSLRDPEQRREMRLGNYLGAALLAPACVLGVPAAITLGNALRIEAVTALLRREIGRLEAGAPALREPEEVSSASPE